MKMFLYDLLIIIGVTLVVGGVYGVFAGFDEVPWFGCFIGASLGRTLRIALDLKRVRDEG